MQLVELQNILKDIHSTGAQIIGISYDSEVILKNVATKLKITFPLLSDPGSKTIETYGIRNTLAAGTRGDGIPYPMTLILSSDGFVKAKFAHEGFRERHTAAELLAALKTLTERKGNEHSPLKSAPTN